MAQLIWAFSIENSHSVYLKLTVIIHNCDCADDHRYQRNPIPCAPLVTIGNK